MPFRKTQILLIDEEAETKINTYAKMRGYVTHTQFNKGYFLLVK